ncbi:hypothetical protein JFQ72_004402 [Vibrio parahaemolyticus]|nr:hypothetical protein [Vibrio parahaemolyticus]
MGSENRKRTEQVKVRVDEDEKARLITLAKASDAGSTGAFMRNVSLAYKIESRVDMQAIEELAKLNANLGRVGGLLKMWLNNPEKARFGQHLDIPKLVDDFAALQKQIADKVREL